MTINQKAFAAMVGVTPQAVSKAVKSGRLTLPLDSVKSLAQWQAGRAPAMQAPGDDTPKPARKWPEPTTPPKPRPKKGEAVDDDADGLTTYNEAKTKETAYKARLRRLEYQERNGSLVNSDEVKARWQELAQGLRTRLMSIPQGLAPRLASMSETHDIRLALEEAIRNALQEVADDARRPAP